MAKRSYRAPPKKRPEPRTYGSTIRQQVRELFLAGDDASKILLMSSLISWIVAEVAPDVRDSLFYLLTRMLDDDEIQGFHA